MVVFAGAGMYPGMAFSKPDPYGAACGSMRRLMAWTFFSSAFMGAQVNRSRTDPMGYWRHYFCRAGGAAFGISAGRAPEQIPV